RRPLHDQVHLRLSRAITPVRSNTAASSPCRHEYGPGWVDSEPARVANIRDDRREVAVGPNTDHTAGVLLGNEQPSGAVEGDAEGSLKPARNDRTGVIGRNARYRAGFTIGYEDIAVGVDHDALKTPEAVGEDLERRERGDLLVVRRAARRDEAREDCHQHQPPPASHRFAAPPFTSATGSLYGALRMR